MSDLARILLVDDEPNVVQAMSRNLHGHYDVVTATSADEGLAHVGQRQAAQGFAVVVSDLRMPHMDGIAFLKQLRATCPDTVRVLLTGEADLNASIAAVNEGNVFRFLCKPCPPEVLIASLDDAVAQHRLVTAEKELLEQTLQGSIKVLIDILALTHPWAFGTATRLRRYVSQVAEKLGISQRWHVEVAAMLSQLGTITLPDETVTKLRTGRALDKHETMMVERLPEVTRLLLVNIPRLEPVIEILAEQDRPDELRSRCGRLLATAVAFDALESQGLPRREALLRLARKAGPADREIADTFADLYQKLHGQDDVREIPISQVVEGMVFVHDVFTHAGTLLVTRGYGVTASFMRRLENIKAGTVRDPVYVLMPPR